MTYSLILRVPSFFKLRLLLPLPQSFLPPSLDFVFPTSSRRNDVEYRHFEGKAALLLC